MVDATEAMESKYVSATLISASPTKTLIIVGEGKYDETDYGRKLTLPVEIDGKQKEWRVNKDTATNLNRAFGIDTKTWLGKNIKLNIVRMSGKDAIIGMPV